MKIYLAGGCFWGVEAYFQKIKGITDTKVGYANGNVNRKPSYEEVCNKNFEFIETVEVTFNEKVITLNEVLAHYFRIIDPFSLDKQGNDIGIQYRTGIYYEKESIKEDILEFINFKQSHYNKIIQVEVKPLKNFYLAEEYHQDYLIKNPHGYCHVDIHLADIPLKEREYKF